MSDATDGDRSDRADPADLQVTVDGLELAADWTDDCPETRAAVEAALPLSGRATRWGDELYFETPVDVPAENPTTDVPEGALAYWPTGGAVCLFWGPTPASTDGTPRAASPVDVFALVRDVSPLAGVDGEATVTVTSLERN